MAHHPSQPHQTDLLPSLSPTSLTSESSTIPDPPTGSTSGFQREIQLGFVVAEEESDHFLQSPFFPSKVGGKPAWLEPVNTPEISQIICPQCQKQMSFLIQVYAPLDPSDKEIGASDDTYHRTLFLFCCKNGACHLKSKQCFRLFRSQLPSVNEFYEDMSREVEDTEEQSWKEEILRKFQEKESQTCEICGMRAGNRCGGCKITRYCSREHQVEDWNLGHAQECKALKNDGKSTHVKRKSPHLFEEFEIETEEEIIEEEDEGSPETHEDEQKLLKLYQPGRPDPEFEEEEEEEDPDKKVFLSFQKKIKPHPDQVLRYSRGNEDGLLWLSTQDKPLSIPNCENCGGQRIFEFEVLPQLLYYLNIDKKDPTPNSLDWGALVCYTCENSCNAKGKVKYVEEYVWLHQIHGGSS